MKGLKPPPFEPLSAPAARTRLSAADRALLWVDRALRAMGHAGFETQTHVWLGGRVDVPKFELALRRLIERHPIAAAGLVESPDEGGPFWQFRTGAPCPLDVTALCSNSQQAVLDHAATLLAHPRDLAAGGPVRFHLLRRPDGRDVFLAQYNHALMDHAAIAPVLREIDRLSAGPLAPISPDNAARDPVRAVLQRFPRERRRRAATDAERVWRSWVRRGVAMLGRPGAGGTGTLAIARRAVEPDEVAALQVRVRRVTGIPSLSMAILASAFRTMNRLGLENRSRPLVTGIGLDLGLRRDPERPFQNLPSLVPVGARLDDLADRDALVRSLNRQMREHLSGGIDLGMLALAAVFGRRSHQARWVTELFFRYGYSLWYAFFGPLDVVGETFCGAPIDEIFSIGPTWAPMGLTLLANLHRGRLLIQATYLPACVPESLAGQFLDGLVDDCLRSE